jgi:lactoylglutathione lyase
MPRSPKVKSVVPFFMVTDMDRSVCYYTEGLGFTVKHKWVVEGKLRWCWLELGGSALMLQEYLKGRIPKEKLGKGVSLWFMCKDAIALYHEFKSRGIQAREPFVGNAMWDMALIDPDGYHLHFESPTDVPEETKLSDTEGTQA